MPVQAIKYEEAVDRSEQGKASVFVVEEGKAHETGCRNRHRGRCLYRDRSKASRGNEQVVTGPAKMLRFLQEGERVDVTRSARLCRTPKRTAGES